MIYLEPSEEKIPGFCTGDLLDDEANRMCVPEFHAEEQKMYDFVVFSVFYGKDFFDEFHFVVHLFYNVSGCCAVVSLFF